jgi:DHA1 family tetracycline resistance protein-like MFS transporter
VKKRQLFTIFLIVLVDLIGFALVIPLLPYYAAEYQASEFTVGLLIMAYSAMSMVGAPILGRFSDRWGRRPVLLVSIFGTFVGFLVLGFANTLALVFLSRIIDGLTGGNFAVAQAYVTDVTDDATRAKGLGYIGAAFGLGFIVGPFLGGTLSLLGYAVPAFFAAGLSLVNFVLTAKLLPESLTPERRKALRAHPRPLAGWRGLVHALHRPRVGPLLQIRFLFGMAFGMFEMMFPLYAEAHLGLTAHTTSYILVYVGVILVAIQGGAIGWLTTRFSESGLLVGSLALLAISLAGWALAPGLLWVLIVLAPLSVAGGILNTVIRSALSKSAGPEEVGGIMGLGASLGSLTRVLAPVAGGYLLGAVGAGAPGWFGAALSVWLVLYSRRTLLRRTPAAAGETVTEH